MSTNKFLRSFIFLILHACVINTYAQADRDEISPRLSSNYQHIVNNKDLHNIGCDNVIIFKGEAREAFIGTYKGIKTAYFQWILYRNNKPVDTTFSDFSLCYKGVCPNEECYFNLYPFAGVYKLKLIVRGYTSDEHDDNQILQQSESNLITVYNDFLPQFMGGYLNDQKIQIYSNPKEIVLDCSMAECMKDYFVSIMEYDDKWESPKPVVYKIHYGESQEYLDVFMLAHKNGVILEKDKKYSILIGPGSNLEMDPDRWYINSKFMIQPLKY